MTEDILDTQIRVIGADEPTTGGSPRKPGFKPRKLKVWQIAAIALAVVGLLALAAWAIRAAVSRQQAEDSEVGVFEAQETALQPHPLAEWVAEQKATIVRGTALKDITINDIPLRVAFPLGAKPQLAVGYDCLGDTASMILLYQAADVRADNKKIVGAFVLHGEPLSWSLSKLGYCGIIGDSIKVGVAANSPLFEEAINAGGDFFRQYPLVSEGRLVENELKTKSLRRALCELEGETVVVTTGTEESLHDFAQALVDLGVSNAIYLVGSSAIGFCRTPDGSSAPSGNWGPRVYKNVSFILWK